MSLNPIVHIVPFGTIVFPLIALGGNGPLIGWAKPVPVNSSRLKHPRRDFVLVAAAGPASNLVMAFGAAAVLAVLPVSPVVLGEPNVSGPLASMLNSAIHLTLLLAVINIIPITPPGGGNWLGGPPPRRFRSRR